MVREVADVALARMLHAEPGWPVGLASDLVLERAEFHGVAPLLQWRLGDAPGVPQAVRDALRERARRAAGIELARRAELVRLLALLHARGVEPVLLKGVPLAHMLYPQPHLRPSVDVDLMIPGPRRAEAFAVLRNEGYDTTSFQGGDLVNAQATYWRELAAGPTLVLDVHWRISTRPLFAHVLPYEWLRARAVPVPSLGPHARGPAPADALLHGCVHRAGIAASQGPADRLVWLHDLHLLAAMLDDAGWDDFLEQAERHGLRALCRQAIEATSRWLDTRIPAAVAAALAAAGDERSSALLSGNRLQLKWAEFAGLSNWTERWLYVRETALPAPEYLLDRYQTRKRWLLPALYVRRALGWLVRA